MSKLYEIILGLCSEKGVSITELCRQSGASRGSLTDLKMGRKNSLSAATLSKIAAYFGVSVDYLLGNEEKPAVAADDELNEILEDVRRNPELRAMFSITKKATPEQVRQYIKVIKALRGGDDDE